MIDFIEAINDSAYQIVEKNFYTKV